MRLDDDDEVYEIDDSYLGPPGRFIAVMRYKVIFLWLIVGPLVFWVWRLVGVPLTLMTVGLTVLAVTGFVMWVADRITKERSVMDLLGTFWQEVTAPRAEAKTHRAFGADLSVVGRPPTRWTKWAGRQRPAQDKE